MTEVSDAMVEAACEAHYEEHPTPNRYANKCRRDNMRAALTAALTARPSPTGEKVEADREALIDFLVNYSGRCRDCADENGFCPRTGIGCGQREQAAIFFVSALEYGSKHGFAGGYTLVPAATITTLVAERDDARRDAAAWDEFRQANPSSVWAKLHAAESDITAARARATIAESALAAAECERDEARAMVVEANNSLFGSQSYFHSANGGDFDKYHLARPIEELKEQARALAAANARVERLEADLREYLNRLGPTWHLQNDWFPQSMSDAALTGGENDR